MIDDLPERLPPPPFWRTRYFEAAIARPDRHEIDYGDIMRACTESTRILVQPDGRRRLWYWVAAREKWLRVIIEPDGVTVHNAFWDRRFKP